MTEREVTPRRLYLMQVASGSIPTPNGPMIWPAVCYLIQMSDGTNVLVDSGPPTDFAPPNLPSFELGKDPMAQLADLGLAPEDIDILICTHFDTDHAGNHASFPRAEFIVQRQHLDLARSGHPRYAGVRDQWDHPSVRSRYRTVEGDTELLPGLTLIETSGHAPGHQSVLVRLPQTGIVLLTIDAVPQQRVFTPDRPAWPIDDNEAQVRGSTRKLLDLVDREQVALTVFGHDGAQWQTLKTAPDHYE